MAILFVNLSFMLLISFEIAEKVVDKSFIPPLDKSSIARLIFS